MLQLDFTGVDFFYEVKVCQTPVFIVAFQQRGFYFYNGRVMKDQEDVIYCFYMDCQDILFIEKTRCIPFYAFRNMVTGIFDDGRFFLPFFLGPSLRA